MTMKRVSLQKRLNSLADNQAAHPEYDEAVIRSMARMPIGRYLGSYDTFCNFQCIIGVGEDSPYQVMAREIADQVDRKELAPEDLAEAVNMLASPVVRIDEAYHRKEASLLPRYKREWISKSQEPLATRLDRTDTLAGPPRNLHGMPIRRFFAGVAALTRNLHFQGVYNRRIRRHMPDDNALFRTAVYDISVSDSTERIDLLYKILVEPFAALPAESERI